MQGILPNERVDVWTVRLAVESDQLKGLWEFLSADERARAERFVHERDRRRFVVGRGALRSILASYASGLANEIRFLYGEHGKPMLAHSTETEGLEFNASGSEELAVCAVTVGAKVGVDIELCRPIADDAFIEQCLTRAERSLYLSTAPDERPAAFYRFWTLKESYLKATGAGLSRPVSSVEVSTLPGEPPRLVADHGALGGGDSWTFVEFAPGPRYVGALVIAGKGRPVRYGTWSP